MPKSETFRKAYRSARDAGVRYFYWKDKKYTTRDIKEDKDEKVYDDKKKFPKRHSTWGKKKKSKALDYIPQTQRKKGGKLKTGGFTLENPIEEI